MNPYRAGSQTKIIRTYGKTTRRLVNTHASLWSDDEEDSKPASSTNTANNTNASQPTPARFSNSDDSNDSDNLASPESQPKALPAARESAASKGTRAANGRVRAKVALPIIDSDEEEEVYVPKPTRRRAKIVESDEEEEEVYVAKPTRRSRAGGAATDSKPFQSTNSVKPGADAESSAVDREIARAECIVTKNNNDDAGKKDMQVPPNSKPTSPQSPIASPPTNTLAHPTSPSEPKSPTPQPKHAPPTPYTTQTTHPTISHPLPSHIKLIPTSHDLTSPPHPDMVAETPLTTRRGSLGWSISPIAGVGLPHAEVGMGGHARSDEVGGLEEIGELEVVDGFGEDWDGAERPSRNGFGDMDSAVEEGGVMFSHDGNGTGGVDRMEHEGAKHGNGFAAPTTSPGSRALHVEEEELPEKLAKLHVSNSLARTSNAPTATPSTIASSQQPRPSTLPAASSQQPQSPHPMNAKVHFDTSYQSATVSEVSISEYVDAVESLRVEGSQVVGGLVGSVNLQDQNEQKNHQIHDEVVVRRSGDVDKGDRGQVDRVQEKEKEGKKEKRKEDRRKTMARRMTLGGDRRVKDIGLDDLLELCDQFEPKAFDDVLEPSTVTRKLGEATYSEVFSLTYKNRLAALKIIPFGDLARGQPDVAGVVQEVRVARCLGRVGTGFVELLTVGVCRGPYHHRLLELWDLWAEGKESENDRPDEHPDHQLYALLFLTDGGRDLEHVIPTQITSHTQIRSILLQLIYAIAQAESSCRFEHRDLHWGNVLVRFDPDNRRKRRWIVGERKEEGGGRWEVEFEDWGVEVTIIDFTLGRVDEGEETCFVPLDDEDFFTGKGKGKRGGDLQFDIYRWMRTETRERWEEFHPKTNVFWLHYLIDKFLTSAALFGSAAGRGKGREEKRELIALRERVLDCGSVGEVLEGECGKEGGYFGCGEGGWEVRKV
ncbi:Serine/threonine-protein kinase haspin [Rhizophlyctis rosea]|uniref:non-specific serine/threonine protein kinase n=1 Tax=Rhizophlyctis rosea TaxID=64517 RepID=A0AAD5SKI6_9FUNG|nr:Serine/threonine-protein kinase haspin [Rhizophlyctis rosea]